MLKNTLKDRKHPIITLMLVVMLVGGGHLPVFFESLIFYLMVFGVALLAYIRRNMFLNILLGCSTVFFLVAWLNFFRDVHFNVLFSISGLLCLFYGIYSTIRFVIQAKNVTIAEVFALINCYLIMGFFWALLYSMVEGLAPGSFLIKDKSERLMDCFIYFSFTTMTTVGFGDMTPQSMLAQRLSITQAVFGQFYFALVVAYLLNKLFQNRPGTDPS